MIKEQQLADTSSFSLTKLQEKLVRLETTETYEEARKKQIQRLDHLDALLDHNPAIRSRLLEEAHKKCTMFLMRDWKAPEIYKTDQSVIFQEMYEYDYVQQNTDLVLLNGRIRLPFFHRPEKPFVPYSTDEEPRDVYDERVLTPDKIHTIDTIEARSRQNLLR